MGQMERDDFIIGPDDPILVTGATGFIGSRLVESLLDRGFRNLICFARPSSEMDRLEAIASHRSDVARIEVVKGNLMSREDCATATKDVAVIFYFGPGRGRKGFSESVWEPVLSAPKLLDANLGDTSPLPCL